MRAGATGGAQRLDDFSISAAWGEKRKIIESNKPSNIRGRFSTKIPENKNLNGSGIGGVGGISRTFHHSLG